MKFSTIAHSRWPKVRAGAENMLWQMEQFLLGKGHEYVIDPSSADWILTQQMWSPKALGFPGRVCQIVHSTVHAGPMAEADLVVYNSNHVAEHYGKPGLVVHPPVPRARRFVTMINLCEEKGPDLFWRVARLCPDVEFLAIRGAYGEQKEFRLKNVTVWETQEDMSKVWAVTRALMVPSVYETYGIAPLEAAGQGIPVIASPTQGLQEAVGGYATFIPRKDVKGWCDAVRSATSGWSKDPTDELETWHKSLLS